MGATISIHREDVKALLRKRYGSIEAFQALRGLSGQQVRDLFRGKSSKALPAVAQELGVEADHLVIATGEIPVCGEGHNNPAVNAHRLSAVTK